MLVRFIGIIINVSQKQTLEVSKNSLNVDTKVEIVYNNVAIIWNENLN